MHGLGDTGEYEVVLKLLLPVANEQMGLARIDSVNAASGDQLRPGKRLIEFTLGLDLAATHDCPPITHYLLTMRESCWLRRVDVAVGDMVPAGASLALLTTDPDEAMDDADERSARVAVAAYLRPLDW